MAFSTQALKYGWAALASLGVVTGTTIYVVNNLRHQVKPEDIIELVLGVHERCLASQYGTNGAGEPLYYVDPPSFVRTWYSNVYTINGVTIYTNVVTNTIGWGIDQDMMVELDVKTKALVPFFVDGTTNILLLSVPTLWARLGIGDGTNLFTRTPAWTNQTITNYIVCYTSFYPATNGTTITNTYTTTQYQVVNYATNWNGTNWGWTAISNWPSITSTTTNEATYGELPWQIYEEDLVERYKVLNSLKSIVVPHEVPGQFTPGPAYTFVSRYASGTNHEVAETAFIDSPSFVTNSSLEGTYRVAYFYCTAHTVNARPVYDVYHIWKSFITARVLTNTWFNTNFATSLGLYGKPRLPNWYSSDSVFDTNDVISSEYVGQWIWLTNGPSTNFSFVEYGDISASPLPNWVTHWNPPNPSFPCGYKAVRGFAMGYSKGFWGWDEFSIVVNNTFLYCTNKFW